MDPVRLQYTGPETYRGSDPVLSSSLTCRAGDVVLVSAETAEALLKSPHWRPFKPRASAADGGVPGATGEAVSSPDDQGEALSTESDAGATVPTKLSSSKKGR